MWTVNSTDDASTLLEAGVTRFTTDEVELLMGWKRVSCAMAA